MRFLVPALALLAAPAGHPAALAQGVREGSLEGPRGLAVKVRMEGPTTAVATLQVVCYFRYTPEGARRMTGAPVELDEKLRGVIASLRERGEFSGEATETILLVPPAGSIRAKALLLIGLGDEASLSIGDMERVGRTALREASRLDAGRVAFAPLLRDQGHSSLATGEVARAVARGMLLAYDTEKRLQAEGLARPFTIGEWAFEAGPKYFDETLAGVGKGIEEAGAAVARRGAVPYARGGPR